MYANSNKFIDPPSWRVKDKEGAQMALPPLVAGPACGGQTRHRSVRATGPSSHSFKREINVEAYKNKRTLLDRKY